MVAADEALPWFSTVAESVNDSPTSGLLSSTEGAPTTRSGTVLTVTATPLEQLFPVLDSPVTLSTQAP